MTSKSKKQMIEPQKSTLSKLEIINLLLKTHFIKN